MKEKKNCLAETPPSTCTASHSSAIPPSKCGGSFVVESPNTWLAHVGNDHCSLAIIHSTSTGHKAQNGFRTAMTLDFPFGDSSLVSSGSSSSSPYSISLTKVSETTKQVKIKKLMKKA
ncbi:hypothetical protein D5086_030738 [Populus alba]|uniref:Uncharacterized protein n=1 Tax=Populus alba TaxID=43335 RepID=A0ACC4AQB8_POPAL